MASASNVIVEDGRHLKPAFQQRVTCSLMNDDDRYSQHPPNGHGKLMQTLVDINGQLSFLCEIEQEHTVRALKQFAQERYGVPPSAQYLIWNGHCLSDATILNASSMRALPFIHIKSKLLGGSWQIFVKTLYGKTLTLDIEVGMTIETIRSMIEEKSGIPVEEQLLIYQNKVITEDYQLQTILQKESTLHVIQKTGGQIVKTDPRQTSVITMPTAEK